MLTRHALRRFLWPAALFLGLGLLYMLAVPAGESPDEPGHLQCVEQVSLLGRLPLVDPPPTGEWWSRTAIISGRMCYHMPLYYLLSGGVQRLVGGLTGQTVHFDFPPNDPGWNGAGAGPMFAALAPGGLSTLAPLLALRVLGLALGLIVVWASGRIADRVWPGSDLLAMLLVAGWPQFVFMSRAVSNDILATALGALALWLLVSGGRPARYVWAALLIGLAVLTKVTMVAAAAVLALAFVYEMVTTEHTHRRRLLAAGGLGLAVLLATLAVIWLEPTLRVHAWQSEGSFRQVRPDALTPAYWGNVLRLTVSSGYARFGWMNLPAPGWQAAAWWAALLVAGAAGVWQAWRQSHRKTLVILALWLAALAALYVRINLNRFQPQFRLVLGATPVLAALAAAGMAPWLERRPHLRVAATLALAALLLAANIWLVFGLILPAYP